MFPKMVIIDCMIAGIAGDMFVAALLDLGADEKRVISAMENSALLLEGCEEFKVTVRDVLRNEIRAKSVAFSSKERVNHRKGSELMRAVQKAVEVLNMTERASKIAFNSIYTLLEAESKIHGRRPEDVHLHEAGRAETVAEIVGVCVGLENLGLLRDDVRIFSTPVAVGGGRFKFSHGFFSSPAPATLQILASRNFPLIGGPVQTELTTPTGASVLVNAVECALPFYPQIKVTRVGYGAGTKEFAGFANVLRIVLGEPLTHPLGVDEVCVIETNVDDVTPEVLGNLYDTLLTEGAKDVYIVPAIGKKGRPVYIIGVIVSREDVGKFSSLLIRETGTLGVRFASYQRFILAREVKKVKLTLFGGYDAEVQVKVGKTVDGKIVRMKPEYDDLEKIARALNKPIWQVQEEIMRKVREDPCSKSQ